MIDSLGFTGTQEGMTIYQIMWAHDLTAMLQPKHVHHGDCIGADEQFHAMCRNLANPPIIHVHPPTNSKKRAFCDGDVVYAPAPYLKRNKHIVQMSDVLIATPKEEEEVLRSGTWSTYRYAKSRGLDIYLVLSGTIVAPTGNPF